MKGDVIKIVDKFLNRWTLKDVRMMTLEDYIDFDGSIQDKSHFSSINTFCYWVEYSFWAARVENRSETPNHRVFRFGDSFCNKFGIVSLRNQSSANNYKEFPDYAAKLSTENYNTEANKPKKNSYSNLVDREGIYYDEYSSEEEINKEGFYVSDERIWDELNHISNYGYSVYSLRKNESNHIDWNTECEFLNGKIYKYNKKYRWVGSLGESLKEAFQNIKIEILKIIEFSQNNDFDKINESKLS